VEKCVLRERVVRRMSRRGPRDSMESHRRGCNKRDLREMPITVGLMDDAQLAKLNESPFSRCIYRGTTGEKLFD